MSTLLLVSHCHISPQQSQSAATSTRVLPRIVSERVENQENFVIKHLESFHVMNVLLDLVQIISLV